MCERVSSLFLLLDLAEIHMTQLVWIVVAGGVQVEWTVWQLSSLLRRAARVAESRKQLGEKARVSVLLSLLVWRFDLLAERISVVTIVIVVWVITAHVSIWVWLAKAAIAVSDVVKCHSVSCGCCSKKLLK